MDKTTDCSFLENIKNNITLPNGWYHYFNTEVLIFFYTKLDVMNAFEKIVVEKQIVITKDQRVRCYILDNIFSEEDLLLPKISKFSNLEIEKLIHLLDVKRICTGGPSALNYKGKKCVGWKRKN